MLFFNQTEDEDDQNNEKVADMTSLTSLGSNT